MEAIVVIEARSLARMGGGSSSFSAGSFLRTGPAILKVPALRWATTLPVAGLLSEILYLALASA